MDNLYYRPSAGSRRRSVRLRLKFAKLLYPVLGLIGFFVVFFAFTNLWAFLSDLKGSSLEESAEVYVASGKAEKQFYGQNEFVSMLSGELLLEGDVVRSLKDSKVILNFFNDTVVRLDDNSMVSLEDVSLDDEGDIVHLKVLAGQIWVYKKNTAGSVASKVLVDTNYLTVNAVGTSFSVKSGLPESVIVSEGNVLISIHEFDSADKNMVEEVALGAGQEFKMDSIAYDAFVNRELPSVISAVSDSSKNSVWYRWNIEQDKNPFSFKPFTFVAENESSLADLDDSEILTSNGPKVTSPKQGEIITEDTVIITGTVPVEAQKVVVVSYDSEPPTPYVLKGFKPGDATFKYIAKYDDTNGNMKKGNNRYEIFYVDENGEESDKTILQFVYNSGGEETEQDSTPADTVDTQDDNVVPEISESLSPPRILKINDQAFTNNYVLKESRGLLQGEIGTWAKSVVINGYKLEQYTPYSGSFVYILSEGFGTLNTGENKVTVTGFDKDGKKSVPVTFTIIKE